MNFLMSFGLSTNFVIENPPELPQLERNNLSEENVTERVD